MNVSVHYKPSLVDHKRCIIGLDWFPKIGEHLTLSYRTPSFIKKITNIKCICHLHFPVSQDSNLRWAFSIVPDILVACSNAVAEGYQKVLLDDLGILPKLEVVPNFVDTQRFKATKRPGKIRKELSIKESENVISIIGLVSQRKGHPDFLKMARLLWSELGTSYFIFMGQGINLRL